MRPGASWNSLPTRRTTHAPTWMGLPLMDWISLPVPLTTPVVRVWSSPKGLPMANTWGQGRW